MSNLCFLFDLDGTLVLTGGAGLRAFDRAFREIFGSDGKIISVNPAGMTDPAILDAVCRGFLNRGPTAEEGERVFAKYLDYLREEIDKTDRFEVMPGVKSLLEILDQNDRCFLGLGTGNLQEGARIKLEYPDLWRYFRFGGFGSDATDRTRLLEKAFEEGRRLLPPGEDFETVYVIGDTPRDITAGRAIGARTIGVATGPYSMEVLDASGADRVYPDLANHRIFLGDIGIKIPG